MPTALVTGASAGLGEGFARELARRGHDLILTARRAERLEEIAAELRTAQGVKVHVFASDLAEAGAPEALLTEVVAAGLPIDLLVNNAGFGVRGDFAELDGAVQLGMIDLNCRALVALAHGVLPGMIGRRSGGILNIASLGSFQPGPWMAVYYATKAFVLSFSEALHEEARDKGVRVSAICPGPTRTEFADRAGMGGDAMFTRFAGTPDTVVRDGLAAVAANRAVKVSGLVNTLSADSVRFLPRIVARKVAGSLQKAPR